jgi:hypothetical protein
MNRHFFSIAVCILLASNLSTAQVTCWPDQSPEYWKISEALYGSKKLSGCHANANYNCHGFVMSYFENGCTAPGWDKSYVNEPYSCPNSPNQGVKDDSDYKNSGQYVQVCTEANANIAYYSFGGDTDHSSVKEITGNGFGPIKYLSKYGTEGPLVAHNLNGSWYHLRSDLTLQFTQFWSYVGKIQGNQSISGTGVKTFSAINVPTVTYAWSIISGYSNIYISSGSNQSTVTLTPTHSGTAVLKLSVSSACGGTKTQQITLNIQTNICLEGVYNNAGIYNQKSKLVYH